MCVEYDTAPVHDHDEHELLWHASGTFCVDSGGRSWLVAPGTGVWVPAGTPHRVAGTAYRCAWALIRRDACPTLWSQVSPVPVSALLRHLLTHLADPRLAASDRLHAEQVVFDLLHPLLALPSVGLTVPRDPRCERIVATVLNNPASPLELADWADEVGASLRTLRRLFQNETTMSFSQWRTHVRMRAAITHLAAGEPVGQVARRVGYANSSAFVTAFRRCTGRSPGTYSPSDAATDDGESLIAVC